jgi:hypothetical protein
MCDGNRRLAVLMALSKYDTIPVRLDTGDYWKGLASKLLDGIMQRSYQISEGRHVPYQPVQGLPEYTTPQHVKGFNDVLDTLTESMGDVQGKQVLDVGSCLGYYSYGLAQRGAYVTGVECTPQYTLLCSYVSRMNGYEWSNPCYVNVPVEAYAMASCKHYDTALLLNVFHYLYREHGMGAFSTLNLLAEHSDSVILSMDHRGIVDSQMNVREFILTNSVLTSCEELGESMFGRNLYVFKV